MKKVWKWILGILIGLVVIAVVLGAGFMVARRFGGINARIETRMMQRSEVNRSAPSQAEPQQKGQGQIMPWQDSPRGFGQNRMPMYYYGGMGHRPFGGLMLIGGLIAGVFKLALLGLVIFLAVTLALRPKQAKQPAAASALPAEPVAEAMQKCPHCAREIQADWKHCPYCGNSLEPTEPDLPVT